MNSRLQLCERTCFSAADREMQSDGRTCGRKLPTQDLVGDEAGLGWWGTRYAYRGALPGVGSALPPPASLPAAVRLNDPHIVPSGEASRNFPSFSLET